MAQAATQQQSTTPKLELTGSRQFTSWLHEQQASLAFTTYQSGKLFLIGMQADGRLSVFERTFNRCMGLWGDGQTLYMSTLYQLWRFENALWTPANCITVTTGSTCQGWRGPRATWMRMMWWWTARAAWCLSIPCSRVWPP